MKLVPRNERKVSKKYCKRIEASLRAVGLIEPLIVYPQGDNYEILDGCLRYRILLEMGVETVPCLLGQQREAFTGNRMVNQLSASQEMRMLRKSLEELDEKTIANALGMAGIGHRLNLGLLKKLDPSVVKAFEAGKINLQCAKELTHVKTGTTGRNPEADGILQRLQRHVRPGAGAQDARCQAGEGERRQNALDPGRRPEKATCSRSSGRPSSSRTSTRACTASTRPTCSSW